MENETITSAKPSEEKKEDSFFKRNKKIIRPIIIIAVAVVLFFVIKKIVFAINYASTDDAQLNANIVTLRTPVSATVKEIRFKDNESVKNGDTLVVFDTEELMAKLTASQAQFYSSQLAYKNAQAGIKGAGLSVDAAAFSTASLADNLAAAQSRLQLAESDFRRMENMFQKGAATEQTYENVKTQRDLAREQMTAARNQMAASGKQQESMGVQEETSMTQAKLAQANIDQARANLTFARSQFDKAFVVAPFDGTVSNRNINVGQYVLGGTPLASLVENKNLWVSANFKETQLTKLRPGNAAIVTVDAFPSLKLEGEVESIGGATGAKFSLLPPDNSSGNFIKVTQRLPVKIVLDSIPTGYALKPGYSVKANVKKD